MYTQNRMITSANAATGPTTAPAIHAREVEVFSDSSVGVRVHVGRHAALNLAVSVRGAPFRGRLVDAIIPLLKMQKFN